MSGRNKSNRMEKRIKERAEEKQAALSPRKQDQL
ncbi:hypothetical protein H206_05367 [Candidatus Electrothrix aarhusensis]|jgi:hypothetical protein|uniref:Uncharacterized protein n=1 Tax=Candidatus Electrothrix aarhusensis TaxID=1859131 RepID=A0A444J4Q2_9BACT|nr:hypothetical protein H206_05367 [Candidatus Electrothrix aarhusensis]